MEYVNIQGEKKPNNKPNTLPLPYPDIHIVAFIHCHAFQIADSQLSELCNE